jgi:hypothetical protein
MQCFLTNRSITLVFDDERNQSQSVNSEISQDSFISSMLFSDLYQISIYQNQQQTHSTQTFKLY